MNKKKKENKILKYIKEHKILISVLSLIVIVLLITGTTLAIFLVRKEGSEKTYTLGNVDVEYIDGDTFEVTNSIPLADYEIEEYAAKKEFSFENTGDITMYAEVLLTEIDMSDNLKNNDFRWELYEENNTEEKTYTEISNGSFAEIKDNKISLKKGIRVEVDGTSTNYKILVYIRDNGGYQNDMMTSSMSAKVTITATDKPTEYVDGSGANPPKLADGMIPVVYDEDADVWVKANVMKKWYDYNNQWWANAVTVSTDASTCNDGNSCVDDATKHSREYYLNANPGTKISMDDINSMWVWIPRYKYRIPDHIGIGTDIPPEIDVVFETGLSSTGVSEQEYRSAIKDDGAVPENMYYTHPAFRDGSEIYNSEPYDIGGWDRELTGIWYSKFQASGTLDKPTIIPNRFATTGSVKNEFTTSLKFANGTYDSNKNEVEFTINENNEYGLNTKNNIIDTHMSKNTEWGMVAALSQSRYGKMGNKNYERANKEIYINNSSYVYTGRSGGTPTIEGTNLGTYSYNDNLCLTSDTAKCTGEKEKYKGTGASTTGTIYGAYDMSGGGWPNVAASYKNQIFPKKYFEIYNTHLEIKEMSKLGDFTWESVGWYSDTVNPTNEWVDRAGGNNSGAGAGIFTVDGSTLPRYPFRTVLIP